ncbi:MAG: septation ring formation regulator EzrA [Bacillales bacterium]|jgi:septation ring formation regulator EzrA|nr:septation ring formation regulator EzrA [Bacillales bacterium]
MPSIIDFIKDNIVIIGVVLGAFVIVALIYIFTHLKKKKEKNYFENIDSINFKIRMEIESIQNDRDKIDLLSKRNFRFTKLFNDIAEQFNSVESEYATLDVDYNKIKHFLERRNLKEVNNLLPNLEKKLFDYLSKLQNISYMIKAELKDEPLIKNDLDIIKDKYYTASQAIEKTPQYFEFVKSYLGETRKKIEYDLDRAEVLLESGLFNEAGQLKKSLSKVVEDYITFLDIVPSVITVLTIDVHDLMTDIKNKYEEMRLNYPIAHLDPYKKIDNFDKRMVKIIELLSKANEENLIVEVNNLKDEMSNLLEALKNEEKCKIEYDEGVEKSFANSERIQAEFKILKPKLEQLSLDFSNSNETEDYILKCYDFSSKVAKTKENVNSSIYSQTPYSQRVANMLNLKLVCDEFEKHLSSYQFLRESLSDQASTLFNRQTTYLQNIRKLQIKLEKTNHALLIHHFNPNIRLLKEDYSKFSNNFTKSANLSEATHYDQILAKDIKSLENTLNAEISLMEYTELLIQIACAQVSFSNVAETVEKGIYLFQQADFSLCEATLRKLDNGYINFPLK